MKLLLFDIDGTLLRSGGAGRSAMNRAFDQVYGFKNGFLNIPMMGRTDPLILDEVLLKFGIERNQKQTDHFQKIYYQFLEQELHNTSNPKTLCPGVAGLLTAVTGDPDLAAGILTGNWEKGAYLKLKYFNIHHHFELGAYADDAAERERLVPFAMTRFHDKYGYSLEPEDVYLIGDTPLDIIAGKPHHVRTVGVATGTHTREDIAAEDPEFLFDSLENYDDFLEQIKKASFPD